MSLINQITRKCKNLNFMTHDHAMYLRDVILQNGFSSLCELGYYHGKSTTYFAAILKEQGFGKIHAFDRAEMQITPNIDELLSFFDLEEFVVKNVAEKSLNWELGKLIKEHPEPIFDFCYIDCGHDFHNTALAFTLIDLLLKPKGMIVFDDATWTAEKSPTCQDAGDYNLIYPYMCNEESKLAPVGFVCNHIVSKYNYEELPKVFDWRIFVKRI
jgi:predicted O-methyltransferase YrrM